MIASRLTLTALVLGVTLLGLLPAAACLAGDAGSAAGTTVREETRGETTGPLEQAELGLLRTLASEGDRPDDEIGQRNGTSRRDETLQQPCPNGLVTPASWNEPAGEDAWGSRASHPMATSAPGFVPAERYEVPQAERHDLPRAERYDLPRAASYDLPRAERYDVASSDGYGLAYPPRYDSAYTPRYDLASPWRYDSAYPSRYPAGSSEAYNVASPQHYESAATERYVEDCYACDTAACGGCGGSAAWRLPHPALVRQCRLNVGGWIEQGVSVVANQPVDRFNGPVTFNDRDGEWQVNQIWLYTERETCGCGFDVGGRVDFVYGTDARFTQAVDGLEADWNQTERFYQVALPQFYLDVAYNDWILRTGHFYTILGYEVVAAPDNFFYSHAYTMQYGEPFTHTGAMLLHDVGPFSLAAGLHRGNNQFNDTDGHDALDFLGGVTWTSPAENLSAGLSVSATEDGPGIHTVIYSLVGTWNVTRRLTYVIQHDYGQSTGLPNQDRTVEWYGLNQYVFYDINDCWRAGLRAEWFRDDDGARVVPGVAPGVVPGLQGNFYEVTAGLNWKPHANLVVRPEFRWDWHDGAGLPYDSGDRDDQFLFGCDVICTF